MRGTELPSLPLGTSDFTALREAGQIYVDKTALIYELASQRGKFFLSRPRRFGKSLLISTLESLFKDGLKYFGGLAIEKLWKETTDCRVVKLDFSRTRPQANGALFASFFEDYLEIQFGKIGFERKNNHLRLMNQLELFLTELPTSSLVLLIDEYDAPLTACLDNPEVFEQLCGQLSDFYSMIKSCDRVVRFLFMTGIAKFSKASIFSELNTLTDITLDGKYGTLIGYTREEVEKNFDAHLVEAGKTLGISRRDLMRDLSRHYDGFCFDEKAEFRVFAPWSLLNFLSRPDRGFINYWFESARNPTVLHQYLKGHSLKNPADYFKEKYLSVSLLSARASDAGEISDLALLTQAGYLTIKGLGTGSFLLGYPNKEVSDSIAWLYRDRLLSGRDINELGAAGLRNAVMTGDARSLMAQLNRVFLALDFTKYPIRDEITCRNYAQLILTLGSGVETFAELHNALGRSDLEVKTPDLQWVFEFKFQKKGSSAEDLLEEALGQIQDRHYGEALSGERRLLRLAAIFSEEERHFTSWQMCGGQLVSEALS